jgi:pimeloyl-ACP methyl ester carboxylesterase
MSRMKKLKASMVQFPDIAAPSMWLLAFEQRAFWEFWAGVYSFKVLQQIVPRGDGHPVLVIPGLGASDVSTLLLRRFLDGLGHVTYPWGLGRNTGLKDDDVTLMRQRVKTVFDDHGRKVSVIGQSLGGVFAREIARHDPDLVRQVITLGSPFTGHPLASTGTHLYEWLSGDRFEDLDFNRHLEMRIKPPVPTTSIFSKLDGVVAWPCSIEAGRPDGESINLRGGSHIGMFSSPNALYLIAERLAQPENGWKPFEPKGVQRLLYGTGDHLPALPKKARTGRGWPFDALRSTRQGSANG